MRGRLSQAWAIFGLWVVGYAGAGLFDALAPSQVLCGLGLALLGYGWALWVHYRAGNAVPDGPPTTFTAQDGAEASKAMAELATPAIWRKEHRLAEMQRMAEGPAPVEISTARTAGLAELEVRQQVFDCVADEAQSEGDD